MNKRLARIIQYMFIVFPLVFLLFGCNNSEKRKQDAEYFQRIKSRKIREVEPLPEIRPYEPFVYSAYNIRSPFVAAVSQDKTKKFTFSGIHPDMNRRKEPLESFPLDSVKMVGTMEQNKKMWALVVDPKGIVYRLTKGNFLGQNHGRIERITADKVILMEIVPDPSGGWRERAASITLSAGGMGQGG